MPFLTIDGTRHYYRLDGRDDRPVVMLSHSLGQDHSMWDPQVADLRDYFQVLRYDLRGHGASDATPGEYTIEQLGRDVLAIADGLHIKQFAFCGLSIGGMIGQWLAVNHPGRLTALVLANSSPRPDAQGMETRRKTVLASGWPLLPTWSWAASSLQEAWLRTPPRSLLRGARFSRRTRPVTRAAARPYGTWT